jgi:hypothetical protein
LQVSRAADPETLQSQLAKTARKRLSLSGLELLHGRLLGLRLISLYLGVYLCLIIAFWLLALGQGLPLQLIDAAAIVPL